MTRPELMKKFQLSAEALAISLKRLLKANAITSAEFESFRSCRDEHSEGGNSRSSLGNHPIPMVTICEVGKPGTRYLVRIFLRTGSVSLGLKLKSTRRNPLRLSVMNLER